MAALAVEKNSRKKNNGSELYRMFAQVKLAQQKRICVCVRCVCAKIVLSKYFVCVVFVRVWTKRKKKMSVDGTRESALAFFGYFLFFSSGRERKFRRLKFVVLFFFQSQKKKRMILAKSATSLFVVESRLPGFGTMMRN
jgi:hypothetical protein